MFQIFASRPKRPSPRALASRARVTIGQDARRAALVRMFALFPGETVIAVVDRDGARIGVVTPERLAAARADVVAELMLAI